MIISQREDDLVFAERIAKKNRFILHKNTHQTNIRPILLDHPRTILFWDGDDEEATARILPTIEDLIPRYKAFVITDSPFNTYPALTGFPVAHHLHRRYGGAAPEVYARLAASSTSITPLGLEKYFAPDVMSSRITLKRSSHKSAAVEAVQNLLVRQQINGRLAALTAQAVDELIMNALFDAPALPDGTRYRRHLDRGDDFPLIEKEEIEVSIISSESYLGICVTDHFGSLSRDTLLSFARKDYSVENYAVREEDPGAGLGVYGILNAGVSMIFTSLPGVKTEASVIIPRTESFKDFRSGFRFLTIRSK